MFPQVAPPRRQRSPHLPSPPSSTSSAATATSPHRSVRPDVVVRSPIVAVDDVRRRSSTSTVPSMSPSYHSSDSSPSPGSPSTQLPEVFPSHRIGNSSQAGDLPAKSSGSGSAPLATASPRSSLLSLHGHPSVDPFFSTSHQQYIDQAMSLRSEHFSDPSRFSMYSSTIPQHFLSNPAVVTPSENGSVSSGQSGSAPNGYIDIAAHSSSSSVGTTTFRSARYIDIPNLMNESHFGLQVRHKVMNILEHLLPTIPQSDSNVVQILEYGFMNSRACIILPEIIANLNAQQTPSSRSFAIHHVDNPNVDIRPLSTHINTHPTSYLNTNWQSSHSPSLQDRVFSFFISRPYVATIVPPGTAHLGLALMDLHWPQQFKPPENSPYSYESRSPVHEAHIHLKQFLQARAREFKKGGVLIVAYIQQSEPKEESYPPPVKAGNRPNIHRVQSAPDSPDLRYSTAELRSQNTVSEHSSPVSPGQSGFPRTRNARKSKHNNAWKAISSVLGACIQRLVSCSLLSADTARHLLLDLPILARSPAQTSAVLQQVSDVWKLEWSCGLDPVLPNDGPHAVGLDASMSHDSDSSVTTLRSLQENEVLSLPPTQQALLSKSSRTRPHSLPNVQPSVNQLTSDNVQSLTSPSEESREPPSKVSYVREPALVIPHPACVAHRKTQESLATSLVEENATRIKSGHGSSAALHHQKNSASFNERTMSSSTDGRADASPNGKPTAHDSREKLTDGVCQLVRLFYEGHFRDLLKEKGKLSRATIEWVLEALWDALKEKIEEGALDWIELEFSVMALRRL